MEINDYVRTKSGRITKIKEFIKKSSNGLFFNFYSDGLYGIEKQDITKHSKDIIDLIEVGDYVNGKKVLRWDEESLFIQMNGFDMFLGQHIKEKDIKSILTHEQFEANAYKIEKER